FARLVGGSDGKVVGSAGAFGADFCIVADFIWRAVWAVGGAVVVVDGEAGGGAGSGAGDAVVGG
ncbi:hypothetical protein CEN47_29280, partial [Fischerella thermalis CCMEE 5319]